MSGQHIYRKGLSTGPPQELELKRRDGTLIDFTSGWTYSAKIVSSTDPTLTTLRTKTAGITGAATSPNLTIDYETADHTPLTAPGEYKVILACIPTSGDTIVFENLPTFTLGLAPT